MRVYSAVIERCPQTGLLVGFVPGFAGAHSQGETLDELNRNLQEVIAMLLEDGEPQLKSWAASPFSGRCTTVPFHPCRDISPILPRQIAKDIGLTVDDFLKHR